MQFICQFFVILSYYYNFFNFRPGIKELLNYEFFAEDVGLKLEMVSRDEAIASDATKVEFRLRVLDPKKRSNKHKENEAIQFDFDMAADNADEVAGEMVCKCVTLSAGKVYSCVPIHEFIYWSENMY